MAALTVCEIADRFCTAKPNTAHRTMVTTCFVCGRSTCLSCGLRMEVKRQGLTMGAHVVCHACAVNLTDGPSMVATHYARLGGRGVPYAAPQAPPNRVLLPTRREPKPKVQPKAKSTRREPRGAERVEPAPSYFDSPRLLERQTPAAPVLTYPVALLKVLGYGD